ncbi:MAG: M28 family peptidase [Anaerolineales bacterium]
MMNRILFGGVFFVSALLLGACDSAAQTEPIALPTRMALSEPTATAPPTATDLAASATPSPSATATVVPTATHTPQPTATFSPTPAVIATRTRIPTATPAPPLGQQTFGALAVQINQAAVINTIAELVNFESRHTNSARGDGWRGIDAARAYLAQRLQTQATTCANPAVFYEDPFTVTYRGETSQQANLILAVGGPDVGRETIVLGAHYDTMSDAQPHEQRFLIQPGANDNGSGVASIVELARLYCAQPRQARVVFVLFAAEEIRLNGQDGNPDNDIPGRIGSRHFVSNFLPGQPWNVTAMLNLDTIGSSIDSNSTALVDDRASIYSAGPENPSRQLARQVQAAAYVQMPDFQVIVENREDRRNRWGDHMSFTRAGIPAARLIEGAEDDERQDTRDDRLNFINPPYLMKNIQVVLAFLLSASEGPPPPGGITANGGIVFWDASPGGAGYLVASRAPGQQGYQFDILPTNRTGYEFAPNTIFAVGTISNDGILGSLSSEVYIP